jgi:hypothetical protein
VTVLPAGDGLGEADTPAALARPGTVNATAAIVVASISRRDLKVRVMDIGCSFESVFVVVDH